MAGFINVVGQTFGSLTVARRSDRPYMGGVMWECQCECGGTTHTTSYKLKIGHTTSCGCKHAEKLKIGLHTTHGLARTHPREYKTWKEMRNRCHNSASDNYKWYGGRGIRICALWSDFSVFFSDMGERPPNASIDRIDNDGNYEPANCRWLTHTEQVRKQARTKLTADLAESMRGDHANGMNYRALSAKYAVCYGSVAKCITRKSWV